MDHLVVSLVGRANQTPLFFFAYYTFCLAALLAVHAWISNFRSPRVVVKNGVVLSLPDDYKL